MTAHIKYFAAPFGCEQLLLKANVYWVHWKSNCSHTIMEAITHQDKLQNLIKIESVVYYPLQQKEALFCEPVIHYSYC